MITIVSDAKEIKKYQQILEEKLNDICYQKMKSVIGHRGSSSEAIFKYSPENDFWFRPIKNYNRYWNGFGLGKPNSSGSTSIVVEINPPLKGIQRNIAGAFGKNERGEIFLLHRGNIGGGRKGIGKKLFVEKYGLGEKVVDGNMMTKVALVSSLSSKRLGKYLGNFIRDIDEIKSNIDVDPDLDSPSKELTSFEKGGLRKKPVYSDEEIKLWHADVVNALIRDLKASNSKVFRDKYRDAYIRKGKNVTFLFEVKLSSTSSDVAKAVGQLLLYSANSNPSKILVLPEKVPSKYQKTIDNLGIETLVFRWDENDVPHFDGLNQLLNVK